MPETTPTPPMIAIVGKSDSGKTTLIEKLVPVLKRRGFRIGVVKHAAHGFQMDRKGKDSWRHRAAGADTVMVVAPDGLAVVQNRRIESMDDLGPFVRDVDLVIAEGFKQSRLPKIEVVRAARNTGSLCLGDTTLLAMVTDTDIDPGVPCFGLEEVEPIADLIQERLLWHPDR